MSTLASKTETSLVTHSVKDYASKMNYTTLVPVVRVNENGYPYITFINDKNEANNIYFSRKAAEAVTAGQPVTKDMLKSYQIGITTNAEGEERPKLISNSDRVEISSLLD